MARPWCGDTAWPSLQHALQLLYMHAGHFPHCRCSLFTTCYLIAPFGILVVEVVTQSLKQVGLSLQLLHTALRGGGSRRQRTRGLMASFP